MKDNDQNDNIELVNNSYKLEELKAAITAKKKLYIMTENNTYRVVYKDAAGIAKDYCCQSEMEIDKLTDYVWKNLFNEIGKTGDEDTAVDVAIRELKEMKSIIERVKHVLSAHGQRDLKKEIFNENEKVIIRK